MKKKEKNCEHKSFQLNNGYWKCQFCEVDFTNEEVERIMIQRRQGFEELNNSQKTGEISDLK